ncbi:helicase-associated domain-containing protein [Corynebacterium guangdongense]|uniref:Helicase XPB/Ssl2 N-terminal domain-containing protein n=1 Tax=Corynebacterium guangdongense TaxID=1783348 RepID=A0ABU1ZV21_9CORY|nr:helicase-associated domain-containing protein [Corynebacterium guangdongense]MDR7328778.1 hypothetical protein [Corynebacterium guangdongense]WJZ17353.1 hypothetical protein CGUA_03805 [Corynebacterium guangdongense]
MASDFPPTTAPSPDTPDFRTWLANLGDVELTALLRARPDVIHPIPPSITPLAGRLQLRASVARALRGLSTLELAALEAAADLGAEFSPVSRADVAEALVSRAPTPVDPALAEGAVDTLVTHALLFGEADRLLLVRETMSMLPASWRLLGEESPGGGPDTAERIAGLEPGQRKVLDTLVAGGGLGTTRDAAIDADPSRPIPQLIEAGLLTRVDANHVRLPRHVSQVLRGTETGDYPLVPSERVTGGGGPDPDAQRRADESGAAQGLEATRTVRRLVEYVGDHPLALNKDSTLGVRATGQIARALDVERPEVHRLIAVATAARLIGRGELPGHEESSHLAPTRYAVEWLEAPLSTQFARVIAGWWASPWQYWRVGEKDDNGATIRMFDDASRNDHLPHRRRLVTQPYVRPAEGIALTRAEAMSDFRFTSPLAASTAPAGEADRLLAEAEWMGVTAGGVATTWLRTLHAATETSTLLTELESDAAEITPAEVDRIIIQADLTVLAPGPLPAAMQSEMELLADLESAGLASVYRVSETTLRRALDAGRSAGEIGSWLAGHALGEIPQSLSYLLEDLGRRHGHLRGGAALSYLRSEEPALLDAVFAAPAAETAGLRRLAPTVAVSTRRLAEVLELLREAGIHAAAEDEHGAAVDIRPEPPVLPAEKIRLPEPQLTDPARIDAAVKAIRRGESERAGAGTAGQEVFTGSESLSVLQAAARGGRTVRIGVVDKHGQSTQVSVRPMTVTGGQVDAVDPATGRVQRFPLHRITQVILD